MGFAQQNANADLLAVGAVYDRAVFAVEWDERAVIDRAYSCAKPHNALPEYEQFTQQKSLAVHQFPLQNSGVK